MRLLHPLMIAAGLLLLWQFVVLATAAPAYILPGPLRVASAFLSQGSLLLFHGAITLLEILLGFVIGALLGTTASLAVAAFAPLGRWLLPLLVASQAIPVFALAPLLVLWLGYGLASKVAMAVLIIFFPVSAAFLDGLRRTEPGWLDLARTMDGTPARVLLYLRLPAALPALASGLRVAAAVAPIGAVVGEWVGAGAGLGYLMLQANARLQVDLMFAALLLLALLALALYYLVVAATRLALPWVRESA